jgi:Zn ribbon nucleic-acid-binding protein
MTRPLCPACKSPDTVSYWAKASDDASTAVYRSIYPDARRCVDCEHIWWGEAPKPLNLAMVKKAEPFRRFEYQSVTVNTPAGPLEVRADPTCPPNELRFGPVTLRWTPKPDAE